MSESWIRVCPRCEEDRLQVVTDKEGTETWYWCPFCETSNTLDELEYGAKKE